MKRLVVVLGGLLALPAFAEVAPYFFDDAIEYWDAEYADNDLPQDIADVVVDEEVAPKQTATSVKTSPRVSTSSRSGSRTGASTTNVSARRSSSNNSRAVSARTTTSRTTTTPSRTVATRGTTTRASTANTATPGVSARRATNVPETNVARAGSTTTSGQVKMTTTSGNSMGVFEDNNLYTGRVGVRSYQSSASRVPTIRVASATVTTGDTTVSSNANAASAMDQLAEMTDYCRAQYTACMDNFCNVLDDNQGRCSCSKNLKNYEKTEQALKAATEELQDVAQKIQYIGLTADQITTIFSETEAEEAMRSQTDTSQIKSNLDKIRDMIIDVKTGTASGSLDTDVTFDLSNLLDFTISSTGFDLSGVFGISTGDTSSISNQRGETLYKTAAARCKSNVLNACVAQGVDASVITNSYDLEIDKQCIAYERSLIDSNTQMTSTVRNAKAVLQRARLVVNDNKNKYKTLRDCLGALDVCMQDDYVCGTDYENCLDPTGKYIVNGQVVVGSLPGKALGDAANSSGPFKSGLYGTWVSGNNYAWDYEDNNNTGGDLAAYINDTLDGNPTESSTNMSKFLQYKIGYHDNTSGKNHGMCMSVLNQCQDITYEKGNYKPDNNVVAEYLYRTMVQIKASQDTILANYAENCISDVQSCLNTNGYANNSNSKNIAVNACKGLITTCMSVNGNVTSIPTPSQLSSWAQGVYDGTVVSSSGN